ncbi:MAG: diaminopimelate decarboxylase [Muribaculaceae bacterium]|nr:diaminopimelate decarboxylase [Muribaculaceae bacterium]
MKHRILEQFQNQSTPFYCYDLKLLRATLDTINQEIEGSPFVVHYAVKANGNPKILAEIQKSGLGVDLVSGNEILASLEAGFDPKKMAYAGVGKTDREIEIGLDNDIYCFNVESEPEMEVINEIAARKGKTAGVAIRVNPDIDAHTHRYITTGTASNKFGIDLPILDEVVELAMRLPNIHLRGLHFHIGSQITKIEPFKMLCDKINELLDHYEKRGVSFEMIDVGGGLGIDYENPEDNPIAPFHEYFQVFKQGLKIRAGQMVHFELGRSIVAQCGALVSRVVFVKENSVKKFVILDAGMTDLLRPALYDSHHKIVNLTSQEEECETYDVVGPICESSDVFSTDESLPVTRRGDLIAILSAGAYGESMSSTYNMRSLPQSHFIE